VVKLPICYFDAKTGVLCKKCARRLRSGRISSKDVEVSRLLTELERKIPAIQSMALERVIPVEKAIILAIEGATIPEPNAVEAVTAALQEQLKQTVTLVPIQANPKETLASLFRPLEVLGVDRIFVPDGTVELKVRLRGEVGRLTTPLEQLQEIASKITKTAVRLVLN
jgi:transcription antitermination factor NusA-like protein